MTTKTTVDYDSALCVRKLTEYQFAGDDEGARRARPVTVSDGGASPEGR